MRPLSVDIFSQQNLSLSTLTFPIFFLSFPSHPPFQSLFPVLRLCCMCTASPYLLFFSIWQTHAPSLTTYRGIMGEHEIIMSFRPFNGVVPVSRPCHIWPRHTPSGFQTKHVLYVVVKVRKLSTLYVLFYVFYRHHSLHFLLTF